MTYVGIESKEVWRCVCVSLISLWYIAETNTTLKSTMCMYVNLSVMSDALWTMDHDPPGSSVHGIL